jgi:hypothetical protein
MLRKCRRRELFEGHQVLAVLLDGSYVTGPEVGVLPEVRVEYPHHRGVPSPRGHGSRGGYVAPA